jgi:uncharacterized membrane protein (UPF0136 family)
MASPNPVAAGAPLALVIIAGSLIGAMLHQPTIGFLVGTFLGTALAVAIWLKDKNKIGQ